jgi:hypothetical protein
MTHHDGDTANPHDEHAAAPDQASDGAGSESPEEGAAAQKDADDAATTDASPTGDIG